MNSVLSLTLTSLYLSTTASRASRNSPAFSTRSVVLFVVTGSTVESSTIANDDRKSIDSACDYGSSGDTVGTVYLIVVVKLTEGRLIVHLGDGPGRRTGIWKRELSWRSYWLSNVVCHAECHSTQLNVDLPLNLSNPILPLPSSATALTVGMRSPSPLLSIGGLVGNLRRISASKSQESAIFVDLDCAKRICFR